MNSDCPKSRACINNKCKDPCPGVCGQSAECHVANHSPYCSCFPGYTGNPSIACHLIPICMLAINNTLEIFHSSFLIKNDNMFVVPEPVHVEPCNPSPCGPYSQCRDVNGHAVCSCLSNYIGAPPSCRPECASSSECSLDKACINLKCVDPCPGVCGSNARCQVTNHNPICSCSPGFRGDPFVQCLPEESKLQLSLFVCFFYTFYHACFFLPLSPMV